MTKAITKRFDKKQLYDEMRFMDNQTKAEKIERVLKGEGYLYPNPSRPTWYKHDTLANRDAYDMLIDLSRLYQDQSRPQTEKAVVALIAAADIAENVAKAKSTAKNLLKQAGAIMEETHSIHNPWLTPEKAVDMYIRAGEPKKAAELAERYANEMDIKWTDGKKTSNNRAGGLRFKASKQYQEISDYNGAERVSVDVHPHSTFHIRMLKKSGDYDSLAKTYESMASTELYSKENRGRYAANAEKIRKIMKKRGLESKVAASIAMVSLIASISSSNITGNVIGANLTSPIFGWPVFLLISCIAGIIYLIKR